MNWAVYLLFLPMTLMGAFAGYFFKKASARIGGLKEMLTNPYLYAGGFLYLIAALLNIYVLRILPYSLTMPLTAITYIWTMLVSYFLLGEKIGARKLGGVAMILAGVCMLMLAV